MNNLEKLYELLDSGYLVPYEKGKTGTLHPIICGKIRATTDGVGWVQIFNNVIKASFSICDIVFVAKEPLRFGELDYIKCKSDT